MSGFLLSIAAGILPMLLYAWFLYYLDRYEKEPFLLLLSMFSWGALIAAGAAFLINSFTSLGIYFITQNQLASQIATSMLVAPLVEETLKGSAILLVYLLFKPEFDSPLDGIVYGGIAGLGFAASENAWYIHQFGYQQTGLRGIFEIAFVRVILVGWQHPFYTAFTGLGLALSRQSKQEFWRWSLPFLGWSFAVAFHTLHNLFASLSSSTPGMVLNLAWDWTGYLGLLVLILLLIKREQKWMKEYLAPVRDEGLIHPAQYQIACSAWRQGFALLEGIFQGNARYVKRFYQACGDLMHKLRQNGNRPGDSAAYNYINQLKTEIEWLGEKI